MTFRWMRIVRVACFGLSVIALGPAHAAENATEPPKDSDWASFRKDVESQLTKIRENELRVKLGAFGDLQYRLLGSSPSFPVRNDFAMGEAALAVKGQFGPHARFIDENVISFEGENAELSIDRLMVTYIVNDQLRLSGGRDHTAIGHWNRTHNYAAQLQTTIHRPFFLEFEDDGGVVPTHITGLTAEGDLEMGASELKYEMNLGNSDVVLLQGDGSGNPVEARLGNQPSGDPSSSKAVAARLVFKPAQDGDFALGVASLFNRYNVAATPDLSAMAFGDMGQLMVEGEVLYSNDTVNIEGEFYWFNDQMAGFATQGSSNNKAFYLQADIEAAEDFRPYVRIEDLNLDGTDPFFQALLKHNETLYLAGFRLDWVPQVSCVKLEGRLIKEGDGFEAFEVGSQWAFGF